MKATLTLLALLGVVTLLFAQEPAPAQPGLIAEGQPTPVIRLNDHTGRAVGLQPADADEEGTWKVLAFFPKAATPG